MPARPLFPSSPLRLRPRPFSSTSSPSSSPFPLSQPIQVYTSRLTDPYLNLSIEHFLLQHSSPASSTVLLLYTNRPCVVIGRNQNPWVEADLSLVRSRGVLARLRRGDADPSSADKKEEAEVEEKEGKEGKEDDTILLVRRRSGGGAVFHDGGNANWSVTVPTPSFDRSRHAGMVVRALSRLGVRGCRVNARHDIVVDIPPSPSPSSPSPSPSPSSPDSQTYKISGSAYKLTRQRSLHHGTCLLASPHLAHVGRLLRSPAAPYVLARGVDSVRSPVRNVGVAPTAAFERAVVAEFAAMYGRDGVQHVVLGGQEEGEEEGGDGLVVSEDQIRRIPEIMKGYEELKSPEWIYAQTPQFTFSTHPTPADPRPRPAPPSGLRLSMTVRHGQITEFESDPQGSEMLPPLGKHLHLVRDWREYIPGERGAWLNSIFGGGGRGGGGDGDGDGGGGT
ncbi:hypothetical protein F4775DRAFT_350306 [Biscogniauxia sp. FL1348]|nr:hypothetical protein F4775DRAFT_350306 [Biscogniauxia sp. FL1348]